MTQYTTPKDINSRVRMDQALSLRKAGCSYDAIAKACGYSSRSSARKAVIRAMHELPKENAEELRALQMAQLNELLMAHWSLAKKDVGRAHLCLKILAQQADLQGLRIEPQKLPEPKTVIRLIPAGLLPDLEQRLLEEQATAKEQAL